MEEGTGLVAVVVIAGVISVILRPGVALMLVALPMLIISDYSGLIGPVVSIGEADVRVYDVCVLVILARIAMRAVVERRPPPGHPILVPIGCFVATLGLATLQAGLKLGSEIFRSEIFALLRFGEQVAVFVLLLSEFRRASSVDHWRILQAIGYALAASVYVEAFRFLAIDPEPAPATMRFFGVVGDQVSLVLAYFIFAEILAAQGWRAGYFLGAFVATGARGATVVFLVGLALIAWRMRGRLGRNARSRVVALAVAGAIIIVALVASGVGSMGRRWFGEQLEGGLAQRARTGQVAATVFLSHPVFGVGYTGFRHVAVEFGAVELLAEDVGYSPNFVATAANQYLQILTDGGIAAFVAFVVMIRGILRLLHRASRDMTSFRGAKVAAGYIWVVALLVGNQTAVWLLPGSVVSHLFWIIVAGSQVGRRASSAKWSQVSTTTRGSASCAPYAKPALE